MASSQERLTVGVDLGTTHCALCVGRPDGDARHPEVHTLPIPQLVSRGAVEARSLLPSFHYFAHSSDGPLGLPWAQERDFAVGEYARARAGEAPGRVIASAKSWLSQSHVERRAAILPPHAPEEIQKISPVEASRRYLAHMGEAWTQVASETPPSELAALHELLREQPSLSEQEVVLTVPASFDAAARELTSEAAAQAGLRQLTLLEEPQAALYAWIESNGEDWRQHLAPGDVILVVDIGGGTTDFSAIVAREQAGSLELHRVAVGDHILLGGDNMDLALAYAVRTKLGDAGKRLDAFQMSSLTHACRVAKERLLSDESLERVPISIASRGANLFASTLSSELTRSEVQQVLVEGFFPSVGMDVRPQLRSRSGLTRVGLAYASDPAVTKHLADFLRRQANALEALGEGASEASPSLLRPNKLLFNGGVLKALPIRERIVATLNAWLAQVGAPAVQVLPGDDPDLAVARGAAYYGQVRRGRGLRIRGGTARAYYVGVESPMPAVPGFEPPLEALCVAPFGMEEGSAQDVEEQELLVVVGEPVRFRFFGSSERRSDQAGELIGPWEQAGLAELSPIEITLPTKGRAAGDVVPVRLRASVTEVGTLLLEAVPLEPKFPDECWKVELGVRAELDAASEGEPAANHD